MTLSHRLTVETEQERQASELAASLSAAAYIDIRLVRIFRLHLHPTVPTSAEAVLWFGPLVSRAGGGTMTLDAQALPRLRRHLLARPPDHPAHPTRVRELLVRIRDADGASGYLRAEEELIWLGLRGAPRSEIDDCLRGALADIQDRSKPTLAASVARWAARALPRLPSTVMAHSGAARLLAAYAGLRFGVPTTVPLDVETARLLQRISTDGTTVEVGARIAAGMVELSCPPVPGSHWLTVPGSDPIVVDMLSSGSLAEPLDGTDADSTISDQRPHVVVVPVQGASSRLVQQTVDLLDEYGFAATVQNENDVRTDPPAAGITVVLILDALGAMDGIESAPTVRALAEANVLTVLLRSEALERAVASGTDAEAATTDETAATADEERERARASVLDVLAQVLAVQTPRAVAAVPRHGFVSVPAEGPVWLRASGEPWHVLTAILPAGVARLAADDPRAVGPFRLLGRIDKDELGTLYLTRARDGQPAVLHLIDGSVAAEFARDFRTFEQRWARIADDHVVTLLDADVDHSPPYFLTEYVDGEQLDEVISPDRPIRGDRLVRLAYQLAVALAALHDVGIVHGHLSADAVLLRRDALTLMGMHRCRPVGDPGPSILDQARPPHFRPEGTPTSSDLHPSADIYGWASLVYRAASGRPDAQFLSRSDISTGNPVVDALVERSLDRRPPRRPTSRELVDVLGEIVSAEEDSIGLPLPKASFYTNPDVDTDSGPAADDTDAWRGRIGWSFILPPEPSEHRVILDERDTSASPPKRRTSAETAESSPSDSADAQQPAMRTSRPVTTTAAERDEAGPIRLVTNTREHSQSVELSPADRATLVDELARVFSTERAANRLFREVGIPLSRLPSFRHTTSIGTWSEITLLLDRGIIADPYPRLLRAALQSYPANSRLRQLANRYGVDPDASDEVTSSDFADRGRVFISHAQADTDAARTLFRWLRKEGFTPWLAIEDLLPGQDWTQVLDRALQRSRVILVLLSNATPLSAWQSREIRAITRFERPPGDAPYVVPVRLEPCQMPAALQVLQSADLFAPDGYQRLVRALRGIMR
ncbi:MULTISPECIES: TIR domain-containing protein [unclassified Frankia]|uniref:TIR domain-containing protein n=1 Tax=unclassified Frankia TaxID=2632575 RepID=UPI002AD20556|nr:MULTISPECIES: TIR domain-containing protein [unclassified Frankia]